MKTVVSEISAMQLQVPNTWSLETGWLLANYEMMGMCLTLSRTEDKRQPLNLQLGYFTPEAAEMLGTYAFLQDRQRQVTSILVNTRESAGIFLSIRCPTCPEEFSGSAWPVGMTAA